MSRTPRRYTTRGRCLGPIRLPGVPCRRNTGHPPGAPEISTARTPPCRLVTSRGGVAGSSDTWVLLRVGRPKSATRRSADDRLDHVARLSSLAPHLPPHQRNEFLPF